MSILADFVDRIAALQMEAMKPRLEAIGQRKAVVVLPDGVREVEIEPAPRQYSLFTLSSLAEALGKLGSEGAKSAVFVGSEVILAYLDEEDRRDMIRLPFQASEAHKAFLRACNKMNQKTFIEVLRTSLHGVLPTDLLPAIRRISFFRRADGSSKVEHAKESLGRSVESELQSTDVLPENVTATFPFFSQPAEAANDKQSVDCSLMIDPDDQTFRVVPQGDSYEKAAAAARSMICEDLEQMLTDTGINDQVVILEGTLTVK
jgi:hypothetical protein